MFELFLFVFLCVFLCFLTFLSFFFLFFSFLVFVFFRYLQLFFKKNGNLSSLFSRRKYFLFVFRCVLKKNLDIFFLLSPSPPIKSHFSFSVLSFSLFLDVLFNYPCLQEKTKKCFLCPFHKLKLFVE